MVIRPVKNRGLMKSTFAHENLKKEIVDMIIKVVITVGYVI